MITNEDFEGTGTPTNWFAGGSPNFDSTTSPLAGAQSLRLPAGSSAVYPNTPKLLISEIYVKFKVKISNLPVGGTEQLLRIRDDSFQQIITVDINTDGTLRGNAGTVFASTVSALSAGTIYDVWVHALLPAATAVVSVAFATTGSSEPTSGNNFVGGTGNTFSSNLVGDVILGASGNTRITNIDIDDVQLDSVPISGAATVTVNLTGVAASPVVGTLTFNGGFSVAGVAASPAIGTGTVTTAPPATVTVTLTGVGATPAIGIGHVAIQGEVIVPPDQGLFTGGPPHWYGIPKDEKVYLTGVAANPQVGRITPVSGITLEEMEKMFPFPRREAPVTRSVPRRKTKPPVFVYMAGVHPVPKVGSVTTKMFYEDNDEELSSILKMMDVDEELITALKLAK